MGLGWIFTGPGSTWIKSDYSLTRNPKQAGIFQKAPAEVLRDLEKIYKCRFRVEQLKTEYVGTWRDGQWAEIAIREVAE